MNYLGIDKSSISNGPGVRVVLWVAGCTLHCKGCQNPESWDFCAGKPFDETAKLELFDALDKPYIKGITISGGNPLDVPQDIFCLVNEIKHKFKNKDIWLYSGYTYDEILASRQMFKCITEVDVLVDGPYIEEQRDTTLKFSGSKNQRLINVRKTIEEQKVVLYE